MSISQRLPGPDEEIQSATLLLVEDDVLQRAMMADFLRLEGFNVLEAGNVAEAKRVLSSGRSVQLVVTDIHMPGDEDGIMLAEHVQVCYPRLPVLILSGAFTEADVGQRPFLRKPFRLQKLLSVAQTLLCHQGGMAVGGA